MTLTTAQAETLSHLRGAYLGPEQGETEVLVNRPSLQYAVGMLFPAEEAGSAIGSTTAGESDPEQFILGDVEEGDVEEDGAAPPLAEDWRPSSAALSFVTDADTFISDFSAATYTPIVDEGPLRWQRDGHDFGGITLVRDLAPTHRIDVGSVPVEIGSRWRKYGNSWLVTLHVRLLATSTGDNREDIARMLFQVDLGARPSGGGRILQYDVSQAIDVDLESRELRLRYRDRKVYGVGHGMAAGWDVDASGSCSRVFLDPVPHFVVPAVEQALDEEASLSALAAAALDLEFLQRIDTDTAAVTSALFEFVEAFDSWAGGQVGSAQLLGEVACGIADRSQVAAARMRAGV